MQEPKNRKPSLSFDEDTSTLKRKTGRGAGIIMVTQALQVAINFGWTIVMARMLTPSDFGLVAMALPAYKLAILISGMGIGQAVIQRAELTHAELSNLYWYSLGIFIVAGLVTIGTAPFVGQFYGVSEVASLVVAYGLILIVNGVGSIHGMVLLRRLRFVHRGVISILALVFGVSVGLFYAWKWQSFWALIAMEASSAVAGVVLTWVFSGWTPGRFDRSVRVGSLLRYGANVAVGRIMNFFTDNIDSILIAKFWGQAALGFYDRAFRLMLAPTSRTTMAIAPAAHVILSRLVSNPARYRRAFLSLNRLGMLCLIPGFLTAVILADHLVPALLGEGWDQVVPIFQAFGVLATIRVMVIMLNWLFLAEGRAAEFRKWGIFRAVVIILAMVIGLPWGPVGIAAAYAAAVTVLLTPIHMVWVTRSSAVQLMDLVRTILIFLPGIILSCAGLVALNSLLGWHPAYVILTGLVISYALVWGTVALFPAGRDAIEQGIDLARAAREKPVSESRLGDDLEL